MRYSFLNDDVWTIKRLLNWTTQYFTKNCIENPRLDAEVLLADSLKTNRLSLYLNYDKPLQRDELRDYKKIIRRRAKRKPLQYIIGYQEFWSLKFKVNEGVLIPRPETEVLLEEALNILLHVKPSKNRIDILEIGTGSGAIAITLAKEIRKGTIIATDISDTAIKIAKENARMHGVENCVTFLKGSLFQPVRENVGLFNLVISNPPYIPTVDFKNLQPEVRDFEPRIALDGGEEGLRFYHQIIPQVGRYLAKDGWLMLEVGKGQSDKVEELIESTGGFHPPSIVKDLSGVERVIKAQNRITS